MNRIVRAAVVGLLIPVAFAARVPSRAEESVQPQPRERFAKSEHRIRMRDGAHLFTIVYAPRDASPDKTYPILMLRTCYSIGPYGPDAYRGDLGPSRELESDGYIFVYQDVRGCYQSEGTFVNMTPHRPGKDEPNETDESSDTYDTIEWLVRNVPHHNGRVGQWGISYPGFYAAAGMIDAHPALKAVSPQAPIADWWYDDFHHHGAFFLPHAFNFLAWFGHVRPEPTTQGPPRFDHPTRDGYRFFLEMGSLANANPRYLNDRIPFWNAFAEHPNYDAFWQARNLLPHLRRVAPAVMIVGGWFDAEDLYGPLRIYREVERNNADVRNSIVMGPWSHGGWSHGKGDHLGNVDFESATSEFYREQIEYPFFHEHLKGDGRPELPEAFVFETGGNRWRRFDAWPPAAATQRALFFREGQSLQQAAPGSDEQGADTFVSDPNRPVPFTERIDPGMVIEYMTDDQRFAARRPDVAVYATEPLAEDLVLAGPVVAELEVATSQADSDWIVKLIDVFPGDAKNSSFTQPGRAMSDYQMLVRSDVMRGRFRDDPSRPTPFRPGEVAKVRVPLQDVLHRFRAGHRLMVQVQCTWFPLVDRNPQKWVDNIYRAADADFTPATQRIERSAAHPSRIEFSVLDGRTE
ncbi:MAG: CocE/NonD family hydrolase [Planctomycetes bacterium]|nr:CocE/NonD family hydrolase [Planctomycetota bacterium]